jgi:DNA-binding transcriptional MerR regulator
MAAAERKPVEEQHSITELATEFGITPRTIRFYEGEGLIAPARSGTQRLYSRADRARLAWILRGRKIGFSLAEIRELLDLYAPAAPQAQMRATRARCAERIAALQAQRADLDATITELSQFVAALDAKLGD